MPLTGKNKQFNELHKYYTTRNENPLKKMQSLIALCGKLIRVMYKMIKDNVKYDGEKMLEDIHRNRPVLQAA